MRWRIRWNRAFTLTELSAVVGVIGILAAVATPSLQGAVQRARTTEARSLVVAIAHAEQRAMRDTGRAIPCPPTPAGIPHGVAVPWPSGDAWRALGVSPVGPIRFQYAVEVEAAGGFRVVARGDLDGDGVSSTFMLDGKTLELVVTDAEE
ncbi:MAG: hypothetical protein A2138_16215 [Deltaproteobacteria bacterium RBG_16_71_12]|nr:MAG: hypothetical protein A2138_16215 [Deltaproteobacteria bacterium RBG_16_71_12]